MASELVIREVKAGIWTFSVPFKRSGVLPVGGRSTALKLKDGSVFLVASTKADDETLTKIREIGPVKYIIAPDYEHYLNLKDFHKAFPEAKVIGVEGLEQKPTLAEVKFSGLYGKDPEGTMYGYEDEISACYFSAFKNKDVAFCHKASKTLIEADLVFNLPPREQYSKSKESPLGWIPFLSYVAPFTVAHPFLTAQLVSDNEVTKVHAKTVNGWDFDTIIPCHGDVMQGNGKAAWQSVWDKWLH
ncbi:hypothetical protein FRB96_005485 [Tulasnella sp. 330]|nr:hypothetical protein FRB96_005485 [Tulasnella sp. 330]KAG8878480.1 hypothetical protein FRB97_002468 [Tulasnella sp. 331]KAG8880167.1 hypothetical protein FRB98_005309 [Tulasnella sp. 332]